MTTANDLSLAANNLQPEIAQVLRSNGLHYVDDSMPGISRRRSGERFFYVLPNGKPLRDADELARIRALAIPPAYEDVWICASAEGHLQATGRDARGRKQYRYHPQWRELRDGNKYEHMVAFGHALPKLRRRVQKDLQQPALSRANVMATIVSLLEATLIRVGNEEYARDNKSFGITTLRNRHVEIHGNRMLFKFRGKSGVLHERSLTDKKLARIVKRCRDLPGQELFQYLDDEGNRHSVTSSDVNAYLKEITGEDFTAKDFRTWAGTVLTAVALCSASDDEIETSSKTVLTEAIKTVASRLGNTPAICRRCYVHPDVIAAHSDGSLPELFSANSAAVRGLHRAESSVLALLQRNTKKGRRREKKA